jgi:diacylglycerol kinase (ATP)
MAKYGRISNTGRPDDGLFEVVACRHGSRWRIAVMALRAATIGLGTQPRVDRVEFATVEAVPFQVDGEIRQLDAAADMVIDCLPQALATVG